MRECVFRLCDATKRICALDCARIGESRVFPEEHYARNCDADEEDFSRNCAPFFERTRSNDCTLEDFARDPFDFSEDGSAP